jgi:acyl-CoA reductase-like NAD-dependent aldehyde dehydrogenase
MVLWSRSRLLVHKSLKYIDIAPSEGATVGSGGGRAHGEGVERGLFVAPTILTDVVPGSRVEQEEVFGPLLSVIPFCDEDGAVRITNDTANGLTASVWTIDLNRGHRIAGDFEAGCVWINSAGPRYPNMPYGGVKASGVGGKEEFLEELLGYAEEKAINIAF